MLAVRHDVVTRYRGADLDLRDHRAVRALVAAAPAGCHRQLRRLHRRGRAEERPVGGAGGERVRGPGAGAGRRGADGAAFVHYSTDFVFDGETDRPYTEEDQPNPRSIYALLQAARRVVRARRVPRHYVLRVESLFGGARRRRDAGAERGSDRGRDPGRASEARVFVDRTVSPSYVPGRRAGDTRAARARRAAGPLSLRQLGLVHLAGSGPGGGAPTRRRARGWSLVGMADAALKAERPAVLRAVERRSCAPPGFPMPTWQDALARYLAAGRLTNDSPGGA